MSANLKQTSLYNRHIELGAKIVPFAGYAMPVYYQGIALEHRAVRSSAGLFDVSHMGEFIVQGDNSETYLQYLTINDITLMNPGQAQYSAMCREDGGIIDDLIIYRYPDHFMLVVNGANIEKDYNWLKNHLMENVDLKNVCKDINLIALQGPESREILQKLTTANLASLPFYHFMEEKVAGKPVTIARTGYTGELGYEIYGDLISIPLIWDSLMTIGNEYGLVPAGLGARDTLRLEMKYCLYGNDINESTNPIEAGLGWITKVGKGEFIGRKAIMLKKNNAHRRLVCVEMIDRAVPRQGYGVWIGEKKVGKITSGTQSPSLNRGIGLAYINKPYTNIGTELTIDIRGKLKRAIVVKPPFYRHGSLHV